VIVHGLIALTFFPNHSPLDADGSLVAVFGGFINFPGAAEPTVSVLDTRTWTWVTLPYNGLGRGNAACTISEDTFIIWGGFFNAPNTVKGVPLGAEALLLFSLTNKTFHTTYTPSDALAKKNQGGKPPGGGSGTGPDPSGSGNGSGGGGGGLSTGAIGGIAAGCVALLLVAAFTFLDRRRRRRKYDKPFDPSNHGTGTGSGPGYPDMSTHYDQIAAGPRPLTGQYNQGRPTSAALLHPRHSMQSMDGGNSNSVPTTPSTMYFMNEHGGVEAPLMVPGGGTSPIRYSGRQSLSYPVDPLNPYYPQPVVQQPVIPEEDYRNTYANSNVSVDRRSDPQSVPIVGGAGYVPYNAGLSSATTIVSPTAGADAYHDNALRKHVSYVSTNSTQTDQSSPYVPHRPFDPRGSPPVLTAPPIPQRPLSGLPPQGGYGIGSVPEHSTLGGPQALMHQPTVVHQYPYQPPPPPSPQER